MKKKISIFLIAFCMCLGLLNPDVTAWAASGKTAVSVSASSVNIGDTITVTGKATGPSGEKVLATMQLSWDASVLQFVSCSVDSNGGGGNRLVNGDSFTITLKAISAGTSAVSLSASDGVLFDTVESLDAMEGSSTSVTVNNSAGSGGNTGGGSSGSAGDNTGAGGNAGGGTVSETLSADNSLKNLTISPGTLSPSFTSNKLSYTAVVGSDVTNIAVSATPQNAKAVVESVTGNENLADGVNTIKVVVKAENGVTATYTIKVTKQVADGTTNDKKPENDESEPEDKSETGTEESQETITVNGTAYQISEDFSEEDIPEDFTENTIKYHGKEYHGVSYMKGSFNLLWMTPQSGGEENGKKGKFFIYDETRDHVYPFVRLTNGEKYVIVLAAPVDFVMPETYVQTSLVLDEENTITAYQKMEEEESEIVSEFYVFYAVNHEGTENWYQYDSLEGTYQRLATALTATEEIYSEDVTSLQESYAALSDEYSAKKKMARNTIAILVFVIAVLLIIIINLLIGRFKRREDVFDDEFAEEENDFLSDTDLKETPDLENELDMEEDFAQDPEQTFDEEEFDEEENLEKQKEQGEQKKSDDFEVIDFNDL